MLSLNILIEGFCRSWKVDLSSNGPKMCALGRLVTLHCFICLFHTLVKMSAPAEYTWSVGSACECREKAEYARTLLTVHILLRSNISEEFSWAGKIGTFLLAGKNRNISPDRKKVNTETWGSERSPKQTLCLGACETTRIDLSGPPPPSRPSPTPWAYSSRSSQIEDWSATLNPHPGERKMAQRIQAIESSTEKYLSDELNLYSF